MTSSRVSGHTAIARVTPTISSGSIYASGDQLGGIMEINIPMEDKSQWSSLTLTTITVVDLGKQNSDIEILFWNASPTLVSDNAAADFDDTELKTRFAGSVTTGSTYNSYNDNSSVTVLSRPLQINVSASTYGTTSSVREQMTIFASAVVRGTPTYTSTGDLTFVFKFAVDAEY